jgi:hypothetical protein
MFRPAGISIPAGPADSTSPISEGSVNITVETIELSTERLSAPARNS